MFLTLNNDRSISGWYHTAVGQATSNYTTIGQTNWNTDANNTSTAAFTISVLWDNQFGDEHSATSWTGIYKCENG